MTKERTSAQDILARIDQRISALKAADPRVSDRAISLQATGSPDTIRSLRRNIERSGGGISTKTITRLATTLGTTTEWLLGGVGPEEFGSSHIDSAHLRGEAPSPRQVRLVGYVGAGSEAHFYALADEDYEMVDAPEGASDQTVAAEIKGKSFGPLMDGWLVYYDDVRSPITEDLYGEICVVGLADDRILIKQISRERDGSFSLLSNSNEPPIRDAEIEWAARVTDMKRRRR